MVPALLCPKGYTAVALRRRAVLTPHTHRLPSFTRSPELPEPQAKLSRPCSCTAEVELGDKGVLGILATQNSESQTMF